MKTYLLDSVIVIDHLNTIQQATDFIEKNRDQCGISAITRAEVLTGVEEKDLLLVKQLLDQFVVFEISQAIADLAAQLRKTHGWKLPDAFQAALAQENKLKLVTRNTKDFSPQSHPFVVIPYSF